MSERKKKSPVYKRVKTPMQVTPRDVEILRLVADCRLLNSRQIERVLFPPDQGQDHPTKSSITRRRLMLLFNNEYLDRVRTPLAYGSFASQPVYKITAKGRALAQLDKSSRRDKEIGDLFINHQLAINEVRIAVTLAARVQGYVLEQWLTDDQLKSQAVRDYVTIKKEGKNEKMAVIADGFFVLRVPQGRTRLFLELDQGTMSGTRWKDKILAYLEYWRSGKYEARYQSRSFRVLTVTTNPTHLETLKQKTEEACKEAKSPELAEFFLFTTFDQVTPEKVFHSPIWQPAGSDSPIPLIS